MKPNDPRHPWARLVAAARRVPPPGGSVEAPYGFATRVAARAFSAGFRGSLIERFAFRAVGIAGLLAILSIVANYSALVNPEAVDEEAVAVEDPALMLLGD